jgi:hypothetical protein
VGLTGARPCFADDREMAAWPQEFNAAIFAVFAMLFLPVPCNGGAYDLI